MINFFRNWKQKTQVIEWDRKPEDDVRRVDSKKKEVINYDGIFDDIYGHDDLKELFKEALNSKDSIHILLTGAAGTSKSLFLEAIADNVKGARLMTNNSTGAGIINYIIEHPELRYLCIDEIEKIGKKELAVLLTLMESGRLIKDNANQKVNRRQRVSIFASSNKIEKLAPEMRSRFLRLHLKQYTFPEFNMITTNIATKKYKRSMEFADQVARTVWETMGSRDVRDCIKIIKLCKNLDKIGVIARTLNNYSEENSERDSDDDDDEPEGTVLIK